MFLRHCSSSKLPGSPSSCFRFGAYRLPSGTVSPAGRQTWETTRASRRSLLIADWMAASENVCGRPGRPHLKADRSIWRSTRPARRLPLGAPRCTRTSSSCGSGQETIAPTRPDTPSPYARTSARRLRKQRRTVQKTAVNHLGHDTYQPGLIFANPQTEIFCPLMKAELSDAKNSAMEEISVLLP